MLSPSMLFALFVIVVGAAPLDSNILIDPKLLELPGKPRAAAVTVTACVAGGVAAFAAHEAGHLLANALLHNRPKFVPLKGFGFVPFFAIAPQLHCNRQFCLKANGERFAAGPRGKFAIVTAGFEVQHITSEMILTTYPNLHRMSAPFKKGFLAFNIGLSFAYAVSSVLRIEDSHGDAGGAAALLGVSRPLMAAMLVIPAALDTVRYLRPETPWVQGLSRGAKIGFFSLMWAI